MAVFRNCHLGLTLSLALTTGLCHAAVGYKAGTPYLGWGDQGSGRVDVPYMMGLLAGFRWAESDALPALLVQNDDSLVIVSEMSDGTRKVGMVRLTPQGTVNPNFGMNGFSSYSFNNVASTIPLTTTIDQQGQVITGGGGSAPFLCRANAGNGGLMNFSGGQAPCVDFNNLLPGLAFSPRALRIQPGIGILVAGQMKVNGSYRDGVIARLKFNGTLDTTFNSPKGFVTFLPADALSFNPQQIRMTVNGKILLGGMITEQGFTRGIIYRLTAAGNFNALWQTERPVLDLLAIDDLMSAEDDVITTMNDQVGRYDGETGAKDPIYGVDLIGANSLTPSVNDGSIYVGSNCLKNYPATQCAMARMTAAGDFDTEFGNNGLVISDHDGDNGHTDLLKTTVVSAITLDAVYALRFAGPPENPVAFVVKLHRDSSDLIFSDGFE